jgi:cytochrome P450
MTLYTPTGSPHGLLGKGVNFNEDPLMTIAIPDTAEEVALQLIETTEGRTNPYPRYHRLRELEPVHYNESLGMWMLTRYDDCAATMRDPRLGKDYPRQMAARFGEDWRKHSSLSRFEHSLFNEDGPAHSRLRKLVVKGFTRRSMEKLGPRIEAILGQLLEPYGEASGGDLLEAVAFPMPVTIIGELLGVPEEERAQFRNWVIDLTAVFEMRPSDAQMAAADEASEVIHNYFVDLIEKKRRSSDDGMLSNLIHVGDAGDRLSNDELATMATLLFIGGFETTANMIGNSLYGLLKQPDQIQTLRDEPNWFTSLPDELLRFDGTAQMTVRDALADVEIAGVQIPAGATVFSIVAAANHDPAEFSNPDAIDVRRDRFRSLALGGGAHFCLGASLAKLEIEITIRHLIENFESIELVAEPEFRDRLTLRGLHSLDLEVKPGRSKSLSSSVSVLEEVVISHAATSNRGADSVRPRGGTEGDREWRNALRTSVESGGAQALVQTGSDLATTIVLLARAELFSGCKPDEIAELAATAYPITFEAGEHLCIEGAESLECYVIQEGEAEVKVDDGVVRRGENDVIGERGILEDSTRCATVTAAGHMLTWAISRERLLALVQRSPGARSHMLSFMQSRYGD